MILNKKVGVFLNLVHYRFKLYLSIIFQRHGFDITPEQFLVLDTLWESQIQTKMEESEMCFHEAFLFLLDKVFTDNSKEKPNNTNLH